MLCIAAFIVLLVLGAVSAKYRKLLRRAWSCVARKVTFRPCDTSFRQDVKDSMLAPLALRAPRLVGPASVLIEVVAWVMVVSMVLSLYIVARSGLYLTVYGTCNKVNPEACSLSSTQACGIGSAQPSFWESLTKGDVVGAFRNEATDIGETIAALPGVFKDWDANEYVPAEASYLSGYQADRPTALEIIDPGCTYCAQLFRNIEESGFAETHNVTYIVYPIGMDLAPRFKNSPLMASYLTAIRLTEAEAGTHRDNPTDWAILEHLYAGQRPDGTGWQTWLNEQASPEQVEAQVAVWLGEAGYDQAGIDQIVARAAAPETLDVVREGMRVVNDEIRTVTIPSMIADGKLHKGSVDVADLQKMR